MSDSISAELKGWLEADPKRFEVVTKHYYDLFAYHAAQRLTTFNFFIVSLSFFSNAYATLVTKGDAAHSFYYVMSAMLSFTAYILVVCFSRLDKRNEQIILINERPLRRIQAIIEDRFQGGCWETFKTSNEEARPLRTFGKLLPVIYIFAGMLAAMGGPYGLFLAQILSWTCAVTLWLGLAALSVAAVTIAGPKRGSPAKPEPVVTKSAP
ncbi:MAG: hypothetical protein QOI38_2874 [Sphingomonadales bacterium]|jgi:hypothetical protein|nr:hypothetical protein [Sphingomonadales bacterium]